MEITEVKVFPVEEEKLKAYVTLTFDDCFVIRDLKIISGSTGLFVAMPSKKLKDGSFKDIAHPLKNDFREKIEKLVLEEYEKEQKVKLPPKEGFLSTPLVESKLPDQINPSEYSAPDD